MKIRAGAGTKGCREGHKGKKGKGKRAATVTMTIKGYGKAVCITQILKKLKQPWVRNSNLSR